MRGSMEVANFQSFNPYVTLVANRKDALPARWGEMSGIEDRCFARVAFEGNKTITRASRDVNAYQFLINPTSHLNRAACLRRVRSVLNGSPWGSLRTRAGVISSERHIIRSVDLGKCVGHTDE